MTESPVRIRPCRKCGTEYGLRSAGGWPFRSKTECHCFECHVESRACRKCGTLGGVVVEKSGVPVRIQGHCMECYPEWVEEREAVMDEYREKMGLKLGTIPGPDELRDATRAVRGEVEPDGMYHAPERKRSPRPFSTARLKRDYLRAWRNIKQGWCCEIKTRNLTTAKILELRSGNAKQQDRAGKLDSHRPKDAGIE